MELPRLVPSAGTRKAGQRGAWLPYVKRYLKKHILADGLTKEDQGETKEKEEGFNRTVIEAALPGALETLESYRLQVKKMTDKIFQEAFTWLDNNKLEGQNFEGKQNELETLLCPIIRMKSKEDNGKRVVEDKYVNTHTNSGNSIGISESSMSDGEKKNVEPPTGNLRKYEKQVSCQSGKLQQPLHSNTQTHEDRTGDGAVYTPGVPNTNATVRARESLVNLISQVERHINEKNPKLKVILKKCFDIKNKLDVEEVSGKIYEKMKKMKSELEHMLKEHELGSLLAELGDRNDYTPASPGNRGIALAPSVRTHTIQFRPCYFYTSLLGPTSKEQNLAPTRSTQPGYNDR
ncbi:unnamed protein product [Darwinula stevensoni]|uniref:Uncharacterized protein n=1 Tax=Darwinula stevensoni TaxID=69355 RepID=A0A7R8XDI1_9CRUS|nr:unnamed protein product [Darwinula stevensoni]CAG0893278.1 unnamed protein product [Darwinula stevensoni]